MGLIPNVQCPVCGEWYWEYLNKKPTCDHFKNNWTSEDMHSRWCLGGIEWEVVGIGTGDEVGVKWSCPCGAGGLVQEGNSAEDDWNKIATAIMSHIAEVAMTEGVEKHFAAAMVGGGIR